MIEGLIMLDDGTRVTGRLLAIDWERDLALVKVDIENMPVLDFASEIRVGEDVVALRYPFGSWEGLQNLTISTGVVSAFQSFDGIDYVQTDAAINYGNSGGPLLDMNGRVVGMNSSGIRKDVAEGLNFAIKHSLLSEQLPIMLAKAEVYAKEWAQRNFGPVNGSIEHKPDDGLMDTYTANVSVANATIEARFFNPYSSSGQREWSSGFLFRFSEDDMYHAVLVTGDGKWYHVRRSGDTRLYLRSESESAIETGQRDSNLIRIVANEEKGTLSINGEHVADLDLSGLKAAGTVATVGAYFAGDGVAGRSTRFEDFKIRSIQ